MKLTNLMRDAFIRAVMQDVPAVDYQSQMRSLVNSSIKEIADKHFKGVDRMRLDDRYLTLRDVNFSVAAHGLLHIEIEHIKNLPELRALTTQYNAQINHRTELNNKIRGAIYACSTLTQATEALPEFEKYLPADNPKALRSLPALANVAADFVKAGWPKPAVAATTPPKSTRNSRQRINDEVATA